MIAVDTSSEWVGAVKKDNQRNNERLNIHYSNLGDVGGWGYPLSYEKKERFSDYTNYIWRQKKNPQLVLVDGRFRVCCFLTSLSTLKKEQRLYLMIILIVLIIIM